MQKNLCAKSFCSILKILTINSLDEKFEVAKPENLRLAGQANDQCEIIKAGNAEAVPPQKVQTADKYWKFDNWQLQTSRISNFTPYTLWLWAWN